MRLELIINKILQKKKRVNFIWVLTKYTKNQKKIKRKILRFQGEKKRSYKNFPKSQIEKWRAKRSIHLSLGQEGNISFCEKAGPLDTRVQ